MATETIIKEKGKEEKPVVRAKDLTDGDKFIWNNKLYIVTEDDYEIELKTGKCINLDSMEVVTPVQSIEIYYEI